MAASQKTINWLLSSDPSIRWQVMRDLLAAPPEEYQKERAKIALGGWGADLLSRQDANGTWAGRTCFEREKAGKPSRWNTLCALPVLKWWESSPTPIA